jgi:hypothetical protein
VVNLKLKDHMHFINKLLGHGYSIEAFGAVFGGGAITGAIMGALKGDFMPPF